MLEKDCIQTRGFRNTYQDGHPDGFQLKIRSLYYRGLWLSQIRSMFLIVDEEVYSKDQINWQIDGRVYTLDEMLGEGDVHWGVTRPAVLLVKKPGGLQNGTHHVKFGFLFSSSYLPLVLDEVLSYGDHEKDLILV